MDSVSQMNGHGVVRMDTHGVRQRICIQSCEESCKEPCKDVVSGLQKLVSLVRARDEYHRSAHYLRFRNAKVTHGLGFTLHLALALAWALRLFRLKLRLKLMLSVGGWGTVGVRVVKGGLGKVQGEVGGFGLENKSANAALHGTH
eukprot:1324300-Amorphochlora_amoeboformis.AAC.1